MGDGPRQQCGGFDYEGGVVTGLLHLRKAKGTRLNLCFSRRLSVAKQPHERVELGRGGHDSQMSLVLLARAARGPIGGGGVRSAPYSI